MVQHFIFKLLLAPFSLLYGIGVSLHNLLYRYGLLKSVEFNIPIISVGNLSVGGAGKSPHIEYLVRMLQEYVEVATLSRGYRRKTKGYLMIGREMTVEQAGDEPLQFKRKFPELGVFVSESRTFAVPKILMDRPETQVILLDDAFQHRAIKAGLNILLTEFSHPFTQDYLLPSGRLREWRSAYERADVIVVTKCPANVSEAERQQAIREIAPLPRQRLFFSYFEYDLPYYIFNPRFRVNLEKDTDVLLVSAIARTDYLTEYLNTMVNAVYLLEYEDHHYFTQQDAAQISATFERLESKKKLIITTEKDAVRLEMHRSYFIEQRLPLVVLPARVAFHFAEGAQFDETVRQFLLNFKV